MTTQNSSKVPILFLIFNRPETTGLVFEAIRQYKPDKLFIAADGPRNNVLGEKNKCLKTRKTTEKIDWECKVERLYRKDNLGCKHAVSGAIDWFFSNVNEGIILEDDCLPSPSFFLFCKKMLSIYRDNSKVFHVSGDNFLPKKYLTGRQYYFSKYPFIWGWATWKRAWQKYRNDITDWRHFKSKETYNNLGLVERIYWSNNFDLVARNQLDTWDYQWVYTLFNNGIAITPEHNLVTNIGFEENATHTKSILNRIIKPKVTRNTRINLDIIKRQPLKINKKNDDYVARNVFFISVPMIIYQFLKSRMMMTRR